MGIRLSKRLGSTRKEGGGPFSKPGSLTEGSLRRGAPVKKRRVKRVVMRIEAFWAKRADVSYVWRETGRGKC